MATVSLSFSAQLKMYNYHQGQKPNQSQDDADFQKADRQIELCSLGQQSGRKSSLRSGWQFEKQGIVFYSLEGYYSGLTY